MYKEMFMVLQKEIIFNENDIIIYFSILFINLQIYQIHILKKLAKENIFIARDSLWRNETSFRKLHEIHWDIPDA